MSISDDLFTIIFAGALFCGMLSGFIALSKDRSWLGFALIGILLGPVGLIVTGFAQPAAPTIKMAGEDPERHEAPPPDRGGERPA
jgi:hypothetical protein